MEVVVWFVEEAFSCGKKPSVVSRLLVVCMIGMFAIQTCDFFLLEMSSSIGELSLSLSLCLSLSHAHTFLVRRNLAASHPLLYLYVFLSLYLNFVMDTIGLIF